MFDYHELGFGYYVATNDDATRAAIMRECRSFNDHANYAGRIRATARGEMRSIASRYDSTFLLIDRDDYNFFVRVLTACRENQTVHYGMSVPDFSNYIELVLQARSTNF
jgi:hypothetical protein